MFLRESSDIISLIGEPLEKYLLWADHLMLHRYFEEVQINFESLPIEKND